MKSTKLGPIKLIVALLTVPAVSACDRSARSGPVPSQGQTSQAQRPAGGNDTVTAQTSQHVSATRPTSAPATNAADEAAHSRLYGTWVAQGVDAKMGDVKIKLTFNKDGPVRILAWSDLPFVGQVRDKRAPYEIHGNTISSEALRGGTTVKYRFDNGDLIIEYKDGKTIRFTRAS